MKAYFLWSGIALCLFSLWVLARRDWIRLTRPAHSAMGEVIGHKAGWSEGHATYAAILRFDHPGGTCEVVDQVYSGSPRPPVGTIIALRYPEGHPELARPPRILLWLGVYAFLAGLCLLLLAKVFNWWPAGA